MYGLGFAAENDLVQVTGDSLMVSPLPYTDKASFKDSLFNDIVWYPTTLVKLIISSYSLFYIHDGFFITKDFFHVSSLLINLPRLRMH